MKILKCIAVGSAASLLSIVAMVAIDTVRWFWILRNYRPPAKNSAVAIDYVQVFESIPYRWLIVLFCFGIGFVWELWRLHRERKS